MCIYMYSYIITQLRRLKNKTLLISKSLNISATETWDGLATHYTHNMK